MELYLNDKQIERLVELLEANCKSKADREILKYLKEKLVKQVISEFNPYQDLDEIPF